MQAFLDRRRHRFLIAVLVILGTIALVVPLWGAALAVSFCGIWGGVCSPADTRIMDLLWQSMVVVIVLGFGALGVALTRPSLRTMIVVMLPVLAAALLLGGYTAVTRERAGGTFDEVAVLGVVAGAATALIVSGCRAWVRPTPVPEPLRCRG